MPISSVIPNLPSGVSIDVRVRAFNQAGYGPYSLTQTLPTLSPSPSPTPTGVSRSFVVPSEWRASDIPSPALAGGFTQRVFGPQLALGSTWFKWASDVSATQNADGSITTTGGNNGFGLNLITALPTGGPGWSGSTWTSGAYFEWTMSFAGPANPQDISNGWPSLWLVDMEGPGFTDGSAARWQGQASNYYRWATINVAEWSNDHVPMPAANTVYHEFSDWYGVVGSGVQVDTGYHANGSPFVVPATFDFSRPHKYGFLWIPATATSRGSAQYFIDDQRVDTGAASWNLYNPATPPPPVAGTTAFSFIDARHLAAVFGTGPQNPMTVSAFSVWQRPASPTPTPTETTSGTRMPPATQFTDSLGRVWTLAGGQEVVSGIPVADTGGVTDMLYYNHNVYQHTSNNEWWGPSSPSTGGPGPLAGDPSVSPSPSPAPTPSPGVPAIASAVGYSVLTFGPTLTTDVNWFVVNGTAVRQADGAMRCISTSGFNDGYQAAYVLGDGYLNFRGTAFGGGAYFRWTAKWSGAGNGGGGWPALWMNDIESRGNGFQLSNTPMHYPPSGGAASNLWFEPDVMEDQGSFAGDYGSALHVWTTDYPDLQAAPPRFTFPGGSNTRTSYHTYGALWVPAKPGARGYLAYCFDDVEYQRVTWDYRADRSTLPSPPSITSLGGNTFLLNVGSDLDWRHMQLLIGSGTVSPIDVLKVEVFQASAANNITK